MLTPNGVQKAKESNYEVRCVYVLTCNADINVARIRGRVIEGGHDVPENKIRSRYAKALKFLPQVIDVSDKMLIYDNSVMPSLIFMKNESGIHYFPSEIWPIERLKKLLKH